MGLRIATNVASQAVQSNLRKSSGKSNDYLTQLSSGRRINKAADDAAGMAISQSLEASTKGLRQAKRNANDGISLVQSAEGGMNEVSNILIRLRELSIQAASDTVGANERGMLDKEYQQLTQEVDRIANSTTFNNINLLNGKGQGSDQSGPMEFQVGAFDGENNTIEFNVAGTNVTMEEGLGFKNGSNVKDKDNALEVVGAVDAALTNVNSQRAELGAVQSRLQSTISNLDTQVLNQDAAKSVIRDADIAHVTAELASTNVIKTAGIATMQQANSMPNAALKLL